MKLLVFAVELMGATRFQLVYLGGCQMLHCVFGRVKICVGVVGVAQLDSLFLEVTLFCPACCKP